MLTKNPERVDKILREIADKSIEIANFVIRSISLGHTDRTDCSYFVSMFNMQLKRAEKLDAIFARDREYLDKIAVPLFGEASEDSLTKLFP